MARRDSLFLLSLFLALMPYQSSVFVMGDAALIEKLCSNTLEPEFCKTCIQSNPRGLQDDARALGGISIVCAHSQSLIVHANLLEQVPNQTDDSWKQKLIDCATSLDTAGDKLIQALLSWVDKRYTDSSNLADSAHQVIFDCALQLSGIQGIPGEFWPPFRTSEAFCQVASGVVLQIA